MTIYFRSVEIGKNKNWLVISVTCGMADMNRTYTIEYCGTEIQSSLPLTDPLTTSLKQKLNQVFDMPPFTQEDAEKAIHSYPSIRF